MNASVSPQDRLARAMPVGLPDDEPYVMLPESLAQDLRDSPLAVGIYMLIARSYLVHHEYIPLSPADIDAYNGSGLLRRGAILRAFDRLCGSGWLIAQGRKGQKTSYLPAWGMIGGVAHSWDLAAPGLDRPRSVRAVRVPRIVLDVCLGRLTPHWRHSALIDRYVTRPVLSLHDIGVYGLLWAGISAPSPAPALIQLGLAGATGPLPPPSWSTLLARISQRPLFDADPAAPTLSTRGLQRAGFTSDVTATPEGPPLFFVPQDMIGDMIPRMIPEVIGDMIGDMIGAERAPDQALSAAESGETPVADARMIATANQGSTRESEIKATSSSTPGASSDVLSPSREIGAPQETATNGTNAQTATDIPPAALTATEQTLCALGVYPSVARRYRDIEPTLIVRAKTIAQRLPGRNSLPATLVQLLREEQASPGWLRQERSDLLLGPMVDDPPVNDPGAGVPAPDADSVDLQSHIHAALCAMLDPAIHLYIAREQIMIADAQIVIALPDWFSDDERVAVDTALCPVAAQIGRQIATPKSSVEVSAGQEDAMDPVAPPTRADTDLHAERPPWIDAAQWAQLHLMARRALVGSRWEDGAIVGASPGITRMLRTQLSGLVARLWAS